MLLIPFAMLFPFITSLPFTDLPPSIVHHSSTKLLLGIKAVDQIAIINPCLGTIVAGFLHNHFEHPCVTCNYLHIG